jgi:hypothetical protein
VLRKLLLIILILGCLIAAAPFLMVELSYWRAPKDAQLISRFQAHRADFERLRDMVLQDSASRSFFRPYELDGIAQDRRDEYEKLFAQVGPGLDVGTARGSVRFIAAVGGSWISIGPEWVKGIEYFPSPPEQWGTSIDRLDNVRALPWGNVYLRQIAPAWYLFVQKTD